MSQAAVSQHVATLEGDLGTALFTRGHRGVALTPTGQALRHAVEEGLRTPLRDIKCHHVTTSPCCNWELLSYIAGVRYLARVDSSGALKIARTL